MSTTSSAAPIGGDPSKPGAWTPAQIADWQAVKDCEAAGHVLPGYRDTMCARCRAIVRPDVSGSEPDFEGIMEDRLDFDEESATRAAEARYERMLGL